MSLFNLILLSLLCLIGRGQETYYAYRRFWYTSVNKSSPNFDAYCGYYVDVNFIFNQTSSTVQIEVDGPENNFIALGFPNSSFYELTDRNRYLLGGYSILYTGGGDETIREVDVNYNCGSCNSNDSYYSVQASQDITIGPTSTGAGRYTFTITRDIVSTDPNDFSFDLSGDVQCNPILVTVAVGDGYHAWEYLVESYVYLYPESIETSNQDVNLTYINTVPGEAPELVIHLSDSGTSIFNLTIVNSAGTFGSSVYTWFAFSVLDIPRDGKYGTDFTKIDLMPSDFSVGRYKLTSAAGPDFNTRVVKLGDQNASYPTTSSGLSKTMTAYDDQSYITVNVERVEFADPGQSLFSVEKDNLDCPFHFNPKEFAVCRPFIFTIAFQPGQPYPPGSPVHDEVEGQLFFNPTASPTISPTDAPTLTTVNPTQIPTDNPTTTPTTNPSESPTTGHPTLSPIPSVSPSEFPSYNPSLSPTLRPTGLPTEKLTIFNDTACPSLEILGLQQVYFGNQAIGEFNLDYDTIKNQRRVWKSLYGLTIYFEDRWDPVGEWVITNGSYTLISNNTQNDIPGDGTKLWDHFPNDNIYTPATSEITLFITCFGVDVRYPTDSPTILELAPTLPNTPAPTVSPTPNCTTILVSKDNDLSTCSSSIGRNFEGYFVPANGTHNSRIYFEGVKATQGDTLFYSLQFAGWVIDTESLFAVYLDTTSYPPLNGSWAVYDGNNVFERECYTYLYIDCTAPVPTPSPTEHPSTGAPTAETNAPSLSPSRSPSNSPTNAPTNSPTASPTNSPIETCDALEVMDTDYLDGGYRIGNEKVNSKTTWFQEDGDGQIFWTNAHGSDAWTISSLLFNRYWLSSSLTSNNPPIGNTTWDKYDLNLPFPSETRELLIACFDTAHPSKSPSDIPTNSPTLSPSNSPTSSPTNSPTNSPVEDPTNSPTDSPTTSPTNSPTEQPTNSPTNSPTSSPTRDPCDFLVITGDLELTLLKEFTFSNVSYGSWNDGSYYLFCENCNSSTRSNWTLTDNQANPSASPNTVVSVNDEWRPSRYGNWKYLSDDSPINIEALCSTTRAPTQYPSMSPSMSPTQSPISPCLGLSINGSHASLDISDMIGNYEKEHFQINNFDWWRSMIGNIEIKYQYDDWYIIDNNQNSQFELLFSDNSYNGFVPPSGTWLVSSDESLTVDLVITCYDTSFPSVSPTMTPTLNPVIDYPPVFTSCSQGPYFAFTEGQLRTFAYVPIPTVTDEDEENLEPELIWIDQTGEGGVQSWTAPLNFSFGAYVLNYTATDPQSQVAVCSVSLYIIYSSESSVDTCYDNAFVIQSDINDSYAMIDSESFDVIELTQLEGYVYHPEITDTCYVFLTQYQQNDAINVGGGNNKNTIDILGTDIDSIIIDLLFLLFAICILLVCLDQCRRWFNEYREKKNKENAEVTQPFLDSKTQEEKKMAQSGIANIPDTSVDERRGTGTGIELVEPQNNNKNEDDSKSDEIVTQGITHGNNQPVNQPPEGNETENKGLDMLMSSNDPNLPPPVDDLPPPDEEPQQNLPPPMLPPVPFGGDDENNFDENLLDE